MKTSYSTAILKCGVSLVVLVRVRLSNLAKVTQQCCELDSVQLQILFAFYYSIQYHYLSVTQINKYTNYNVWLNILMWIQVNKLFLFLF
jgi:hypothetical protein